MHCSGAIRSRCFRQTLPDETDEKEQAMEDGNTNSMHWDWENRKRAMDGASKNLNECSFTVQRLINTILQLSHSSETRKAICDTLLRSKVHSLNNLVTLCGKGISQLSGLADKPTPDCHQKHHQALRKSTAICRFIKDQLRSEQADIGYVIETLQESRNPQPSTACEWNESTSTGVVYGKKQHS